MKRHSMKLSMIAALAFAGAAFANGKDVDAKFKEMDTNLDGKISAAEHSAVAAKMFTTMDANADGKVTADEMTAAKEKKGKAPEKAELSAAEKIKAIDTDGDGILTSAEHATGARSMFQSMDSDKDGYLTKAELAAGHAEKMRKSS